MFMQLIMSFMKLSMELNTLIMKLTTLFMYLYTFLCSLMVNIHFNFPGCINLIVESTHEHIQNTRYSYSINAKFHYTVRINSMKLVHTYIETGNVKDLMNIKFN